MSVAYWMIGNTVSWIALFTHLAKLVVGLCWTDRSARQVSLTIGDASPMVAIGRPSRNHPCLKFTQDLHRIASLDPLTSCFSASPRVMRSFRSTGDKGRQVSLTIGGASPVVRHR